MPKIKVVHPFVLNEPTGPVPFTVGDHDISPAQLKHWFLQGCIADGRAYLVQDMPETLAPTGSDEHTNALAKAEALAKEEAKKKQGEKEAAKAKAKLEAEAKAKAKLEAEKQKAQAEKTKMPEETKSETKK